MTVEEKLQLANTIAQTMSVKDVDKNELKKIHSFLCAHRSMRLTLELLRSLIKSPFARRSRRTEGYYRNALAVIERHLQNVPVDDAAEILGWVTRLMGYYER